MTSTRLSVNPKMLVWARSRARLDIEEAARLCGMSTSILGTIEHGGRLPTEGQCKKMCSIYQTNLASLYRTVLPDTRPLPSDYRRSELATGEPSRWLVFEILKAMQRREVYLELSEELEEGIPRFSPPQLSNDVTTSAKDLRAWLGVTNEDQLKWRDLRNALAAWKKSVEKQGILVFETVAAKHTPNPSEMRGAAIYHDFLPIILLNGKDSVPGRIFTIIHELTHLALNQSGLCDLEESGYHSKIEVFCNAVAGELLAPTIELEKRTIRMSHFTDDWIERTADDLKVSKEVIARRLLSMELVTAGFYQSKRAQYQEEYKLFKEAEKRKRQQQDNPGFGMAASVRVAKYAGQPYKEMVLAALDSMIIGDGKAAAYLEVKPTQLAEVR